MSSTQSRRCPACGRAMLPHERACEGCALAQAIDGPLGARRVGRAALVFGVVAATLELGALIWFFLR